MRQPCRVARRPLFTLLLLGFLTTACGSSSGIAGPDAGRAGLGFSPSNISINGMDLSTIGDFIVDSSSCTIDTTENLASCGDGSDVLAFKLATQLDGSKVGVYVAHAIKIPAGMKLTVEGTNGIVLVAMDTIEIHGKLLANGLADLPGAGGFQGVGTNADGAGPGAGGAGLQAAGSGGGYCGGGGEGAPETGDPTPGGSSYGIATITPLVGGSSGGAGDPGGPGGGGGAIQLVAGTSISVQPGGVIHVGGGGGGFGGAATSEQEASGGGSGGSILLESAAVNLAGVLAANGGGGGGGTSTNEPSGHDGTASGDPAPGGNSEVSPGGDGAAFLLVDGSGGTGSPNNSAGGGGGGAGRMRFNSASGQATILGATLSPAGSTECVTQGSIR